jgi:hypothetical protein
LLRYAGGPFTVPVKLMAMHSELVPTFSTAEVRIAELVEVTVLPT